MNTDPRIQTRQPVNSACLAACLAFGLGANTAQAGFSLVDNFDSGTAGTPLSVYAAKWSANSDYKVALDPLNPANKMGSIARINTPNNWGTAIDFGSANSIAVGTTGTVFFRVMVGTNAGTNFGMYLENGIGTDTSKRQVSAYYNIGPLFERGNSSNTAVTTTGFTSMTKNVWYDFWYVASNTASNPTFTVYAAKEGASPIAQTLLSNGIGSVQTFMNNPASGVLLQGLMFLESSGNNGTTDFYFDDIYVDNTGVNLTNPTLSPPLAAYAGPTNKAVSANSLSVQLGGDPTATGGTLSYTYSWSPDDGSLSSTTAANPTASPTATTTYTLTVTDSATPTGATATSSVTVRYLPVLVANAGADKSYTVTPVTIGGSPTASGGAGSGYSYSWSPATGLSSATAANPTASPATTTTYTVTVNDGTSITATDSVIVTVGPATTPYQDWATSHAGGQAANQDYNQDGVPNGVAFFMGMNGLGTNPGVVNGKVTWPRVNAVTSFKVEVSTDLTNWEDASIHYNSSLSITPSVVSFTLPASPVELFVRLSVTP